jgi:hypothetical protein
MGPAFAAVGAGIAALLESTIASRYQIAGAQLQISLVLAVIVTLVYGFEDGMAWAFVGGLCLDFFATAPARVQCLRTADRRGLAALAEPLLSRSRYPGCVVAVLVVTPIFLMISDVTTGLLLKPPAPPLRLTDLVAAAFANAIVAAVLAPLVIGIKRRSEQRERVLWWR